jgi:hypothetical protein
VLMVTLKTNENWVIDPTGCQSGCGDVLMPLTDCIREKECSNIQSSSPNGRHAKSKELDKGISTEEANMRQNLPFERTARTHFANFVKTRIEEEGQVFRETLFTSPIQNFQNTVDCFSQDVKAHMMKFVVDSRKKLKSDKGADLDSNDIMEHRRGS